MKNTIIIDLAKSVFELAIASPAVPDYPAFAPQGASRGDSSLIEPIFLAHRFARAVALKGKRSSPFRNFFVLG